MQFITNKSIMFVVEWMMSLYNVTAQTYKYSLPVFWLNWLKLEKASEKRKCSTFFNTTSFSKIPVYKHKWKKAATLVTRRYLWILWQSQMETNAASIILCLKVPLLYIHLWLSINIADDLQYTKQNTELDHDENGR